VVLNHQPFRQHSHRGHAMLRQSFDNQQRLVLLWLEAGGTRDAFAGMQEAPDFEAKFGYGVIIESGSGLFRHALSAALTLYRITIFLIG
jgi:hypothetical protein